MQRVGSLPLYRSRMEGSDSSSTIPALDMPSGTSVSAPSSSAQMDYRNNLSSWMTHVVSLSGSSGTDNTIVGEGEAGMLRRTIASLPSSATDTELGPHLSEVGGIGGSSYFATGSLPTTSNSPLLSAVIVSQQQTLGHTPFTAGIPPAVSSSGASSSNAVPSVLQTSTTLPFYIGEVSGSVADPNPTHLEIS